MLQKPPEGQVSSYKYIAIRGYKTYLLNADCAPVIFRIEMWVVVAFEALYQWFNGFYVYRAITDLLGDDMLEQVDDSSCPIPFAKLPHPYLTRAMKEHYTDKKYFKALENWWLQQASASLIFGAGCGAELFEYFDWTEDDRSAMDQCLMELDGDDLLSQARLWLLFSKKFPKE